MSTGDNKLETPDELITALTKALRADDMVEVGELRAVARKKGGEWQELADVAIELHTAFREDRPARADTFAASPTPSGTRLSGSRAGASSYAAASWLSAASGIIVGICALALFASVTGWFDAHEVTSQNRQAVAQVKAATDSLSRQGQRAGQAWQDASERLANLADEQKKQMDSVLAKAAEAGSQFQSVSNLAAQQLGSDGSLAKLAEAARQSNQLVAALNDQKKQVDDLVARLDNAARKLQTVAYGPGFEWTSGENVAARLPFVVIVLGESSDDVDDRVPDAMKKLLKEGTGRGFVFSYADSNVNPVAKFEFIRGQYRSEPIEQSTVDSFHSFIQGWGARVPAFEGRAVPDSFPKQHAPSPGENVPQVRELPRDAPDTPERQPQ